MRQNEKDDEKRLIARAKEGDMQAFEQLVRKYQQSIYYLCRRMTGAHQSADDLSQETFIKVYFSLSRFKDEMNFSSWLRKIAVNNSLTTSSPAGGKSYWEKEKTQSQGMPHQPFRNFQKKRS